MKCPDCGTLVKAGRDVCACGWLIPRISEDGLCHDPQCQKKASQRVGNYYYCIDHHYQILKRMGRLTPAQQKFEEQLAKNLARQEALKHGTG